MERAEELGKEGYLQDKLTDIEHLEYWQRQGKTEAEAKELLKQFKDKYQKASNDSPAA